MLKEAIEKICELKTAKTFVVNGTTYSDQDLIEMDSPDPVAEPMQVHTLGGFVDYVKSNFDVPTDDKYAAFIYSHAKVVLKSALFGEFRQRQVLMVAEPFKATGFRFGHYQDTEQFIVGLQSCFVQDEVTAAILKVIGNLQSENVATVVDDGVSQQVTARAGVARVANVTLPNPVMLRPFRTFQEIEQPVSRFVLRVQRGDEGGLPEVALFESDDCQWQLEAVKSIKKYLNDNAKDLLVFA